MEQKKWSLVSSPSNWVESKSLEQLASVAQLNNALEAVGMPDIHPGKGIPVGAAILTRGILYPHLIGNDIGCGMALFDTGLKAKKFAQVRASRRLEVLSGLHEVDIDDLKADLDMPWLPELGTLGGGNHFAEFQSVESVYDETAFAKAGLDLGGLNLLVHSGSRGLGEIVYRQALEFAPGLRGIKDVDQAMAWYLAEHDRCVAWGTLNRQLIGARMLRACGLTQGPRSILDSPHNFLERIELEDGPAWLHRKGAAKAQEFNIIPGSRGSLTYLVKSLRSDRDHLFSVPHGAGRKWERSACKGRLEGKYTRQSIRTSQMGSSVVCHQKELLYEEASEAYKNVEKVVEAMITAGIVSVVATFRPVLTAKI